MAVKERERLEAVEAMEMAQEKYKTVNADHEDLLHQAEKIRNQLIKIQGTLEHVRDLYLSHFGSSRILLFDLLRISGKWRELI